MEIMSVCNVKFDFKGKDRETMDDSLTDFSVGDSSSLNQSAADDEAKLWKARYEEKNKVCKCLKRENEMLNIDLAHEKYKSNKVQNKLQFIKDNQEIFLRLREAYVSLKYNEATGRKVVGIHEQGVQTYAGILCSRCIETEKLREQLFATQAMYADSIVLPKEAYSRMQATMAVLKTQVEKRDKQWSMNMERDNQYKTYIHNLENENEFLKNMLKKRPVKKSDSEEFQKEYKDIGSFKKIIVKYERKCRETCNKDPKYPVFNEKERQIIDQLMSKYYKKLSRKIESRSMSCERECLSRPKSSNSCKYKKSESRSSSDMLVDNPIAMIDMLLERKCAC